MLTSGEISSLSDKDLDDLIGSLTVERLMRRKRKSVGEKADLAFHAKRDSLLCPSCGGKMIHYGKRKDGVRVYRCKNCGKTFSDTSGTGLSSSKLLTPEIRKIILLTVCGCPLWVVSEISGISEKTAAFRRERCIDAAVSWAQKNVLEDRVWIDEMEFAPIRSDEFLPALRNYNGRITKRLFLGVAVDLAGKGYAKLYPKPGIPTSQSIADAFGPRIKPGSHLTHDGLQSHNQLIEELGLEDERVKYIRGDAEYERKMEAINSACSYLRYSFESHRGIKMSNIERYADFYLFRRYSMRQNNLKGTVDWLFGMIARTPKSESEHGKSKKSEQKP